MPRQSNLASLINLRVDEALLTKIDDWRRRQDDIPTRSEAIRRLVRKALDGGDGHPET